MCFFLVFSTEGTTGIHLSASYRERAALTSRPYIGHHIVYREVAVYGPSSLYREQYATLHTVFCIEGDAGEYNGIMADNDMTCHDVP